MGSGLRSFRLLSGGLAGSMHLENDGHAANNIRMCHVSFRKALGTLERTAHGTGNEYNK